MDLDARIVYTFAVISLAAMALARERFGERGLIIATVIVGIVGTVGAFADPGVGGAGVAFLVCVLAGAFAGLMTRRSLPLAGSVAAAVALSTLGFFFALFSW